MKTASLFLICFFFLPCFPDKAAGSGPPGLQPDRKVFADILAEPSKAKLLTYWYDVHQLPNPPLIGNPEERKKMEWILAHLEELPPVLLEVVPQAEALVDGHPVKGEQRLLPGQILEIGNPGVKLRLITCLRHHEA